MNELCPACGSGLVEVAGRPGSCPRCVTGESPPGSGTESARIAPEAVGSATEAIATSLLQDLRLPSLKPAAALDRVGIDASINVRQMPPTEAVEWEQTFTEIARSTGQTLHSAAESLPGRQTGRFNENQTTLLPAVGPEESASAQVEESNTVRLSVPARQLGDRSALRPGAAGAPHASLDYELLDVIGKGGMGVVYAARQTSVDREVAVKMIYPEQAAKISARNDFLSEAVITGELDHPNIVPIHELGKDDGQALFYSMKRVTGTPWGKKLRSLSEAENLRVLTAVADAVAFAHSRGVIHRDLKPDNVMLGEFGEVLLMDWGLAIVTPQFRKINSLPYTPGPGCTPAFAAPELITGPMSAVGPHSDVYLLGGILYLIVTGQMPHAAKNARECCRVAARNEITPTDVGGELVEIALKAMSTKPQDRYADVREFQQAIRDYQSHSESLVLGVRAGDDLTTAKESRRYDDFARSVFGFEQALALWSGNVRARTGVQEARLEYARQALEYQDFDLGLTLLDSADPVHDAVRRDLLVGQSERNARVRRLKHLKRLAVGMAAAVFFVVTGALVWINHERRLAVSAEQIASEERDKATAARDQKEQQRLIAEKAEQEAKTQRDLALRAQRNEERERKNAEKSRDLAEDRRRAAVAARNAERLQRRLADQARRAQEFEAYGAQIGLADEQIRSNAFESALEGLASQSKFPGRGWEWNRLNYLARQGQSGQGRSPAEIETVAVDQHSRRFAVGDRDGVVQIASLPEPSRVAQVDLLAAATSVNLGETVLATRFSSDGKLLAAAGTGGRLAVWNAEDLGSSPVLLDGHEPRTAIHSLAFTERQGRRWLISAGADRTVRVWNLTGEPDAWSTRPIQTLLGHLLPVLGIAATTDASRLVSVGEDGNAVVWEPGPTAEIPFVRASAGERPDGTPRHRVFRRHEGGVYCVALSPDGRLAATAGLDRKICIWNPDTVVEEEIGEFLKRRDDPLGSLKPDSDLIVLSGHAAPVRSLAFSPDGGSLVSTGDDHSVRVWEWRQPHHEPAILRGHGGWVRSCAFAAGSSGEDDLYVLSGGYDRQVKLWNVPAYAEIKVLRSRSLAGHADAVTGAVFSPAGDRIVTTSRDHTARVYELTGNSGDSGGVSVSTRPLILTEGHQFSVVSGQFFSNGRAATAGIDGQVCLWNVESGSQIGRLPGTGLSAAVTISGDSQWILTGRSGNALARWNVAQAVAAFSEGRDAVPVEDADLENAHSARVRVVAFSPVDSQVFFSADTEGGGILWNLSDRSNSHRPLPLDQQRISSARFLSDGKRLVTGSDEGWIDLTDATTGRTLQRFDHQPAAGVVGFALTPDELRVVSVAEPTVPGDPYMLFLWETTTGKRLHAAPLDREWIVFGIAVSPDASRPEALLAMGRRPASRVQGRVDNSQTELRRWDLSKWEPPSDGPGPALLTESQLERDRAVVWSAAFHPDGDQVLTLGGNEARVWNSRTGRLTARLGPHGAVASASFSSSGEFVATAGWDGSFKLWRISAGVPRPLHRVSDSEAGAVNAVLFAARTGAEETELLATAHDSGVVKLWNWNPKTPDEAPRLAAKIRSRNGAAALACAVPQDAQRIAIGYSDGSAAVFQIKDSPPRLVSELKRSEHHGAIRSIAFTQDGRFVATGGDDKQAVVWEASTGQPWLAEPLRGHSAPIHSVAFSRSGDRLLTGSGDGLAKLWDPRTGDRQFEETDEPEGAGDDQTVPTPDPNERRGKELLSLTGHKSEVTSAIFSPDDRYVLTTSLDGTARLWLSDAPPRPTSH